MTKEELLSKKIAFISLGCDKNTVDAERMMYLLKQFGFSFTNNLNEAQIAIINTCAFILPSKTESINKILEVLEYKNENLEKVIVTGCLAQRNYDEVKTSMPEIDAIVRIKNNSKIVDVVCGLYGYLEPIKLKLKEPERVLSTPSHYAFLKIADGCNNFCSYCTIPFIRGRFKSEPFECLISEAKALASEGVRELILVAQDVTKYGEDLYGEPKLVELIQELSKIKNIKWIRLHYCYPNMITDKLLNEINNNPKVCKYLDIPLQHISTKILQNMNRKETKEDIEALLDKIRSLSNYIAIRSTFIVGFPGETKAQVNELIEFLNKYKLDNVGFFTYSRESNTKAGKMHNQIFEFVKRHRLRKVEAVQQKIMLEKQAELVGKTFDAICDSCDEKPQYQQFATNNKSGRYIFNYVFRTQYQSVGVDTIVFVRSEKLLNKGEIYKVKITGLLDIDLVGEIVQ